MASKFYIKKTLSDYFYFTLTAKNGQVILQSEMHHSKVSCERCIELVSECAPMADIDDQSLIGS